MQQGKHAVELWKDLKGMNQHNVLVKAREVLLKQFNELALKRYNKITNCKEGDTTCA
jgi:hypothetical protein